MPSTQRRGGQPGRSGRHSSPKPGSGRKPSSTEGLGRQINNLFEVLSQKYPGATLQAESLRVLRCGCGAVSWSDWEIDAYLDGKIVGVEWVPGFSAQHSENCNNPDPHR